MPEQSTFFEHQVGDKRIVVLKTYDGRFAREAFNQMTPEALSLLGTSLELDAKFDPADIPALHDDDFADFLWEAVQDGAREDWNSFSYFIAGEEDNRGLHPLYVSSDWPSAEAFAQRYIGVVSGQ
jgi:hypothetical protein